MKVYCYIYDISQGLAKAMSQALIGKQLEGVWHTGIVAYGYEFFFGGMGIQYCRPKGTVLGEPTAIEQLGETEIPLDVFVLHINSLSTERFRGDKYHLLNHNCNTFSNEMALFLVGKSIPAHITSLPDEVMATPLGQMLRPMIEQMHANPAPSGGSTDVMSLIDNEPEAK